MSSENTKEEVHTTPTTAAKGFSLTQIDGIQDDVLQRLDQLNKDILKLLEEFQKRFHGESSG